ncbi:unnamed protein product [Symbiodinium necroappetens]|uniref:Uncharacterized protein n=1 Tax=Symbiodinium necroappetens TaxID=1628268 RepID=A0A812RDG0_9DINO|nr:unnamed protein product [Symbiodinium necroappetens]
MSHTVSRTQQQVFRDLKIDDGFFSQMLLPMAEAEGDFDVYLMEKGVMPLLLQGLDALSKHVDKVAQGTTMGSSKQKFNPLVWLAQYLLRNHPGRIHDHRTGTCPGQVLIALWMASPRKRSPVNHGECMGSDCLNLQAPNLSASGFASQISQPPLSAHGCGRQPPLRRSPKKRTS